MVRCRRDLEAGDPCRLGPGRRGRAGPANLNNHFAQPATALGVRVERGTPWQAQAGRVAPSSARPGAGPGPVAALLNLRLLSRYFCDPRQIPWRPRHCLRGRRPASGRPVSAVAAPIFGSESRSVRVRLNATLTEPDKGYTNKARHGPGGPGCPRMARPGPGPARPGPGRPQ